VSQVSIYNYFGSKDALVIECAKSIIRDIIDKADVLLATDMPYLDKLNTALSLCATDINASLTDYLTTSALTDKNFIKLLSDGVSELLNDLYRHFIEAGKSEGYIDPALPTPLILKYISAISTIDLSPESYHDEINALHYIFLHGLLK
jgi:AcrR family transcriptional regulator